MYTASVHAPSSAHAHNNPMHRPAMPFSLDHLKALMDMVSTPSIVPTADEYTLYARTLIDITPTYNFVATLLRPDTVPQDAGLQTPVLSALQRETTVGWQDEHILVDRAWLHDRVKASMRKHGLELNENNPAQAPALVHIGLAAQQFAREMLREVLQNADQRRDPSRHWLPCDIVNDPKKDIQEFDRKRRAWAMCKSAAAASRDESSQAAKPSFLLSLVTAQQHQEGEGHGSADMHSERAVPASIASLLPPSSFSNGTHAPAASSSLPPSTFSPLPPSTISGLPPSTFNALPPSTFNAGGLPPSTFNALPPSALKNNSESPAVEAAKVQFVDVLSWLEHQPRYRSSELLMRAQLSLGNKRK